jgi:hypothetical protein
MSAIGSNEPAFTSPAVARRIAGDSNRRRALSNPATSSLPVASAVNVRT